MLQKIKNYLKNMKRKKTQTYKEIPQKYKEMPQTYKEIPKNWTCLPTSQLSAVQIWEELVDTQERQERW